jgi:hypothetical protein
MFSNWKGVTVVDITVVIVRIVIDNKTYVRFIELWLLEIRGVLHLTFLSQTVDAVRIVIIK